MNKDDWQEDKLRNGDSNGLLDAESGLKEISSQAESVFNERTPLISTNDDCKKPVSGFDFYFRGHNNGIKKYYRFTSTELTPFIALHKYPGRSSSERGSTSGVTGLLRRSAVLPSHGTDSSGNWILVSVGGRSGWARKESNMVADTACFVEASSFKATEAWMGNHAFLFGGKLMLGSDAPLFYLTNILLLVGVSFYFFCVVPHLQRPSGNSESMTFWFTVVLIVFVVIWLWVSALVDPGIIPSRSFPFKPNTPDGTIGGPLGYRYCSTCNIYRPPRSKHCNSCNVCVSKFDHHCPWVGNCIGKRNHRYFFLFLLSISTLTILVTSQCVRLFIIIYHEQSTNDSNPFSFSKETFRHVSKTLFSIPIVVLLGAFTLTCSWALISLACFHAFIISIGQTTNERVRGVYRDGRAKNIFNKGFINNWISSFCYPPSYSCLPHDFSQKVICPPCAEQPWRNGDGLVTSPKETN